MCCHMVHASWNGVDAAEALHLETVRGALGGQPSHERGLVEVAPVDARTVAILAALSFDASLLADGVSNQLPSRHPLEAATVQSEERPALGSLRVQAVGHHVELNTGRLHLPLLVGKRREPLQDNVAALQPDAALLVLLLQVDVHRDDGKLLAQQLGHLLRVLTTLQDATRPWMCLRDLQLQPRLVACMGPEICS